MICIIVEGKPGSFQIAKTKDNKIRGCATNKGDVTLYQ